jgi:enoyl-CoA hydratase
MSKVTLERRGNVALITLENESVKNGLSPDLASMLGAVCDEVDDDPDLGAAVVRGANGTFCSGADTRSWTDQVDWAADEGNALLSGVYEAFTRVGRLSVPTVAAVRGAAVGAGVNLMLSCDLRLVAEDARVLAGFLRIGLHPGGGFFTLAGRAAGREATAAIGLFGEELVGRQIVDHGLAWEAVPDGKVEERALAIATEAARDPQLTRRAVSVYRSELGPPPINWETALEMERGVQIWSMKRRFDSRDLGGEAVRD